MAIAMNFNYGNGNIHCMTTPGKRIRALRKSKDPAISQEQLAELIKVDQSTISDIENGKGLSAENLMKICEALVTTPQYIMRGEPAVVDIRQQIKSQISDFIATLEKVPVNVDRAGNHSDEAANQAHTVEEKKRDVLGSATKRAFKAGEMNRDKNGATKTSGLPKPRGKRNTGRSGGTK